ncbi:MAG: radical SAM protein [bacterium]
MKNKKIILIFCGAKGKGVRLPLAVLVLARPLIDAGFGVELFDLRVEKFFLKNPKDVLLMGVSAWTGKHSIPQAIEVSRKIKKINPEIPIVWGGPHATSLPEETANNKYIDIVVRGAGEECLLELANKIYRNKDISGVKGITYKKNGQVISTQDRDIPNINKITHLPYDLLKLSRYPALRYNFDYLSSVGCPHRCMFCSEPFFSKRKWNAKDNEVMAAELDYIVKKFNPERIVINDSNFFVNKNRVLKFCRNKIERGYKFKIHAECRIDYFSKYDSETLLLLHRAGFSEILFGGESGSDRTLQFIKKDITSEQILKSVKKTKDFDITPVISFMIGFPEENQKHRLKTIEIYDRIMKINPKARINGIRVLTPFPCTGLYDYVKEKHHFHPPETLEEWGKYTLYETNYATWLSKKELDIIKNISIVARYFYVFKLLKSWSLRELVARHHSLLRGVASVFFNHLFYLPAVFRWKLRYFNNAVEFHLWNRILQAFTGKK